MDRQACARITIAKASLAYREAVGYVEHIVHMQQTWGSVHNTWLHRQTARQTHELCAMCNHPQSCSSTGAAAVPLMRHAVAAAAVAAAAAAAHVHSKVSEAVNGLAIDPLDLLGVAPAEHLHSMQGKGLVGWEDKETCQWCTVHAYPPHNGACQPMYGTCGAHVAAGRIIPQGVAASRKVWQLLSCCGSKHSSPERESVCVRHCECESVCTCDAFPHLVNKADVGRDKGLSCTADTAAAAAGLAGLCKDLCTPQALCNTSPVQG